ncbi:putative addiction module antidote [Alkalibacterium subtropicum]|uniref:Putative addiction module antidote n=1 Tax=Alkalibacterium subtropicum TaxID=753702 RepID=A0A1I1KNW9_9LACT|nr:AbrB/MazE/SpoVT family DNA-binding domain-containing protein [Alkalibacterium subtropicum]SFC62457.1 putative addiction module antidote [Alkalibacterium subtropicum]
MTTKQVRKIRKSGNSYVLTIPPAVMEALDLKEGDTVSITSDQNRAELVKQDPDVVNEDFINMVDSIYEEHKETFKSLVDK